MFKSTATTITMRNKTVWENSRYFSFLTNANREELLHSQIPFYDAVKAFPIMLLQLAAKLSHPEARLLIVENIWEEHGNGDIKQFHITTFTEHLNALGFTGHYFENPFITDWIKELLSTQCTTQLFHSLAAIEYIYAVISDTIAQKLSQLTLYNKQTHYLKHSKLDWRHGEDILIAMDKSGIQFDSDKFNQAQQTFIDLFAKLTAPTQQEIKMLANQTQLSFYYTREDPNVITNALNAMNKQELNVLTICSGGEHIFQHLNHPNVSSVTAFDVNPAQLEVCKQKISGHYDPLETGKFEFLFQFVRDVFTDHTGQSNLLSFANTHKPHLNFVIDAVFSESVLTQLFGAAATRYSQQSFSTHFKQVYQQLLNDVIHQSNINANNIILGTPIINRLTSKLGNGQSPTQLNFICDDAENAIESGHYDLIDFSNIGDWMPYEKFKALVCQAFNQLNAGGCLILRRLLGNYRLMSMQSLITQGQFIETEDRTHFYSETVIIAK